MLPFIVIGLADGSIYAIAALGLVLAYKTSGIFNFAHGAVAAGAAYVFYQVHTLWGLPWPIAALVSVLGYGCLMGLALERLSARLTQVPTGLRIVGTLGVLIVIQHVAWLRYGTQARSFDQYLPSNTFSVAGVNIQAHQVIVFAIAIASVAALSGFFRHTRLGLAMRAVVDDPRLLDLTGVSPDRVRRAAWLISSCFASLSGILIVPRLGLDALLLTLLVVAAYAAASVGAFTSLPLVYAGGLLVGVAQALAYYVVAKADISGLGGLPASVPFLILFAVLLLLPKDKLPEIGLRIRPNPPTAATINSKTRIALITIGIGVLALVPFVVGARLPVYTDALTRVVLFLSLAVLVRFSNQISLAQVGFAAVGAASYARFAGDYGLPWLIALLLAGAVVVPLGAVVAVPAMRLAGLFLALATFGFGILLEQLAYRQPFVFGSQVGRAAPRPDLPLIDLSSDRGYYFVVLFVVLICAIGVVTLERSRLGRLLRAMADSPVALLTHGASINITRVMVFCVSAFLAGISGALFAPVNASVDSTSFPSFNSVILLAVLAVAAYGVGLVGGGAVTAAVAAALLYKVIPGYVTSGEVNLYIQLGFGISAVAVAVASRHDVAAWLQRAADTSQPRIGHGPISARTAEAQGNLATRASLGPPTVASDPHR